MKCSRCPYLALEGIENDLSWCKLYNAQAPVPGCEKERDVYLKKLESIVVAWTLVISFFVSA